MPNYRYEEMEPIGPKPATEDPEYGKISRLLEGLYQTGGLLDWAQTRKIARNPEQYNEENPILGQHPGQGKVDAYMALSQLGHYYVGKKLPEELRVPLQVLTLLEKWNAVKSNKDIGLDINKPALLTGALLTAALMSGGKKNGQLGAGMIDKKTPGLLYTRRF